MKKINLLIEEELEDQDSPAYESIYTFLGREGEQDYEVDEYGLEIVELPERDIVSEDPFVSVIIPAYNEERYIEATIDSVLAQGRDEHQLEIIVVANGCNDRTAEIAKYCTPYVHEIEERGISIAKNYGFEKTLGEVVIFLDADTIMKKGTIDLIVESLQEGYVAGKTAILPDENSMSAKAYFKWVNMCGRLSQLLTHFNPKLNNGASACLFSTYDQLNVLLQEEGYLFNPDLKVMEDVELIGRLRTQGPFKFLTKKEVITSTRRFKEEGYIKQFFKDFRDYFNPQNVDERIDYR
jgi:glycosyltransferase involved in cell wall biosynthesis